MSSIDQNIIEPNQSTLTYNRYLKIPELLALQQPQSEPVQHDETLFIVIHQVYELWFKQILHEVDYSMQSLARDELMPFFKAAKRIITIQNILIHQIDVLETMTPNDFNTFRNRINPASGFQSHQFRLLEFKLGAKDTSYLKFFRTEPAANELLQQALQAPSLYDHFLQYMARRGLKIPDDVLNRNYQQTHTNNTAVRDAMLEVYKNAKDHYDLYMALEAMMDVDEHVVLWRYRHIAMVERMIGGRRGTGGSSGANYLATTLSKRFFPEIWDVRNYLGEGTY